MNNKVYVGSTLKSYVFRIKTHINLLNKKKHENPILQNAWNKYGEKNFIFECVENFNEISIDLLLIKENEYIVKYNSCNRNFGYNICSVGKSRIGTKWNDESRKNRQGIGNPMYGKGYLKLGKLNPMFGKHLSNIHKENMSKSLKGIKKPIIRIKLSKPVIMLDLNNNIINEFFSCKDATIQTKILHISEACNGYRKSAGGYKWRWK